MRGGLEGVDYLGIVICAVMQPWHVKNVCWLAVSGPGLTIGCERLIVWREPSGRPRAIAWAVIAARMLLLRVFEPSPGKSTVSNAPQRLSRSRMSRPETVTTARMCKGLFCNTFASALASL